MQYFVKIKGKVLTHLFKILNPGIGPGPKAGPNIQRATLYLMKSLLDVGLLKEMVNNQLPKILLNNLKSDNMNFSVQEPTVELAAAVMALLDKEENDGMVKPEIRDELQNAIITVQKFHGSIQTIKSTVKKKQVDQEKENTEEAKRERDKTEAEAANVIELPFWKETVSRITAFVEAYDWVISHACALLMGNTSTSISWPWLMLVCISMCNGKTTWDDLDVRFVDPPPPLLHIYHHCL